MPGIHTGRELQVCNLDQISYTRALAIQQDLRARRQAGEILDTLLLLEHPPVYTRGRRSGAQELPFPEDFYRARGIELIGTDRGGRVTYHGPGQLVGYPIMAVSDIGAHLRTMEAAIVAALAREGIAAHSRCAEGPDYTGVWVPGDAQAAGGRARERKIASIGVHVSRGVSTHGFAVNVTNDLAPFTWIVACGLPDVEMTSLAHELPPERIPDPAGLRERVARCFCEAHGRRMHTISPVDLDLPADLAHDGAPAVAPLQGAPA